MTTFLKQAACTAIALIIAGCDASVDPAAHQAAGVTVAIRPNTMTLASGATQQFEATVAGTTNYSVTWSLQEGAAGGNLSSNGLFTAPSVSRTTHVIATSVADPSKQGIATVTVVAPTVGGVRGLHVVGNQIRNDANEEVRIHGVNRAGTEYACSQGWGIFDGPSTGADIDASIAAIKTWKVNAIRVPLNETCWLGINGVPAAWSGATYRNAIADYVQRITSAGLIAVLDLHWSAAGTGIPTDQAPMPNRDHSPTFWGQVANAFKDNSSVVFELYNEPFPDSNQNTTAAWTCWRDGGTCPGVAYTAAGMQELLDAVRATGATNVVLAGAVQYSNTLTSWLAYRPTDATGNLAAAWHVYSFNICASTACYTTNTGPVLASVPVVATEIGEDDCSGAFITTLMSWMDSHGGSYVPWVWNTWGTCLSLVSSYDGTARGAYGQAYKDHLAALP